MQNIRPKIICYQYKLHVIPFYCMILHRIALQKIILNWIIWALIVFYRVFKKCMIFHHGGTQCFLALKIIENKRVERLMYKTCSFFLVQAWPLYQKVTYSKCRCIVHTSNYKNILRKFSWKNGYRCITFFHCFLHIWKFYIKYRYQYMSKVGHVIHCKIRFCVRIIEM